MRPVTELASWISRSLISASTTAVNSHARPWTPLLEQTLHGLGCRDSLTPSLVARVIDPHLLSHHSLALGFFNWAAQQPGFAHDSASYRSIFKSLSTSRQSIASVVESLLRQVKAQSLALDSLTCGFVIKTLLQGKMIRKAVLVFDEMMKSGGSSIEPDVCNSLLAALCSEGSLENALKVFEKMAERKVGFSSVGFGVFIWRLCRDYELGKVLSLLDRVQSDGQSSIDGSIIALLVVDGLCQVSRVEEALWALTELRIRHCKPDFMAYRIVAEAFRTTGSVVDVNIVLKMKRKLGVAPRSEFLLSSKLLRGLTYDVAHPDSHVILLKCLAEAKESRIAGEHVKWIRETSPSMSRTVTSQISASPLSSTEPDLLQQFAWAMPADQCGVDVMDRGNICSM
ncbi:unnamed protein product [Linum tenue]|uniref:Pentatricopeptide repeat-containing protein n=1 Tax=Linum tenue TaxID=586396 RepID=A0AAV0NGR7_9ROSI|nr:unnamed protein product [Linum tenue]